MENFNLRKKFMVIDTETANNTDENGRDTGTPLAYDIGYIIADKHGHIYRKRSFVITDVFEGEADLMQSAYYGWKVPQYIESINKGERRPVNLTLARWIVAQDMKEFNVSDVYAYNALFDLNSCNRTLRYITKSKYRYFFPYGTKIHCIWSMACQVLFTQKSYKTAAIANNWISPAGNFQTSAEVAYRYINNEPKFEEEHKGLDDVMIEYEILLRCFRQHKHIDTKPSRACWRIPTKKWGKQIKAQIQPGQ